MYVIHKIVAWLLSPLGLLFCGLLAGALLMRVGKARRAGAVLCGLAVALFWALGCGVTTRLIGPPLEGEELPPETVLRAAADVDAVVLLGGGMGLHKTCGRSEMFQSADRVWEAARVWKALRAEQPKLVLSGGEAEASSGPLLREMGVTAEIVAFPEARNTEEEAKLIAAAGLRRVCLVTSAWHMPRAKMLFARAGVEVVPAPTDYELHYCAELPLTVGDFFPSADALVRNSYAVKEWVARALYGLKR